MIGGKDKHSQHSGNSNIPFTLNQLATVLITWCDKTTPKVSGIKKKIHLLLFIHREFSQSNQAQMTSAIGYSHIWAMCFISFLDQ